MNSTTTSDSTFRRTAVAALLPLLAALALTCLLTAEVRAVYHPRLGRFLQRDPVGVIEVKEGRSGQIREPVPPTLRTPYADGMHLYQYCRSRPTVGLDPSGKIVLLIHGKTLRVIFYFPVSSIPIPIPITHHFGRDEMRLIRTAIRSHGVKDTFKLKGPEKDLWQYVKAAAERNKKAGFHCEPIVLIGYSDGATQIRALSKRLMSEYPNEKIDYVGIIDMARKYLGDVPAKDDKTKLRANVLDGDNYYQRNGPVWGPLKFKGMRIYAPSSVRNLRWNTLSSGEEAGHFNIITDRNIQSTVAANAAAAWKKGKGTP